MKKLVLPVFLCLLVLCLTLPCFASFKLSETYFFAENYQEYKKGLRERKQKMPSNFISYDRVSFLGEFRGFRCEDLERNAYVYFLRSPEGQNLTVAFNTSPELEPPSTLEQSVVGLDGYCVTSGMLKLDMEALFLITGIDDVQSTVIKEFYVSDWFYNENIYYYYDRDGDLDRIVLRLFDGEYCTIKTDFPQCTPSSWVGRLLSVPETARETAIELRTRFWGNDEKTWEQPLSICLSAIGGAVVAAMATWFVTYFVMRKKRGAPAPATAGAPAGEVSAGSEGDVSAASALPESPTPTEGTPPPEEDSKTDTLGRS